MTSPEKPRERLRFSDFHLERLPNGRCRASVTLTWLNDYAYSAQTEGLSSPAGELRCCAQACLDALTQAINKAMSFELFGVKAVRAFDSTVVIVSLAAEGEDGGHRLVGCVLTDQDPARGAALAVLNATNRVLGNRFFVR